jgi:hypothetical protein
MWVATSLKADFTSNIRGALIDLLVDDVRDVEIIFCHRATKTGLLDIVH